MQVLILFVIGGLFVDAIRRDDGTAMLLTALAFAGFGLLLMKLGGLI